MKKIIINKCCNCIHLGKIKYEKNMSYYSYTCSKLNFSTSERCIEEDIECNMFEEDKKEVAQARDLEKYKDQCNLPK